MRFAGGTILIERLSKAAPGEEDVLMLGVLSLAPEIENDIVTETLDWDGTTLRTMDRQSLIRLKTLRGSTQDLADIEKLA